MSISRVRVFVALHVCVCVREREGPRGGVILAVLGWLASSRSLIKASAARADLWYPCWVKSMMGVGETALTIEDILCLHWESLPHSLWFHGSHPDTVSALIVIYCFLSHCSNFHFHFCLNSGLFPCFWSWPLLYSSSKRSGRQQLFVLPVGHSLSVLNF